MSPEDSKDSTVLNIFAFGTNESRAMKSRNIISQFSDDCNENKLILDGPNRAGTDVEEKVDQAVEYVAREVLEAKKAGKPLPKINMMGFSRGAVICLRIANRLEREFKDLKCNIFALDPVAGSGDKRSTAARRIPPNVENYVAPIMMHEGRAVMRAQALGRAYVVDHDKTHAAFLPIYGDHSAAIKVRKDGFDHSAMIVHQLAYDFLSSHGTEFKNGMPKITVKSKAEKRSKGKGKVVDEFKSLNELDPKFPKKADVAVQDVAVLEQFAQMQQKEKKYRDEFSKGSDKARSFNQRRGDFVANADYFVNEYQSFLFKKTYPKIFNYLFESGMGNKLTKESSDNQNSELTTKEIAAKELEILKTNNPQVFKTLQPRLQNNSLPNEPKGNKRIVNHPVFDEHKPPLAPLEWLTKGITQEIRRYQGQRSFWRDLFGMKKKHHKEADAFLSEVNGIMHGDESDSAKVAAILEKAESTLRAVTKATWTTGKYHAALKKIILACQHVQEKLVKEDSTCKEIEILSQHQLSSNLLGDLEGNTKSEEIEEKRQHVEDKKEEKYSAKKDEDKQPVEDEKQEVKHVELRA